MRIYKTAQGKRVDIAALASQNETVRAVGNMKVNARGDTIDGFGKVVVPATQQEVVAPVTDSKAGYTEVDLQRVSEQEKSKLYPQIDSLKEEINLLKKDREAQLAEAHRIAAEKEEEARKEAEAEMDVRSLLEKKEQEKLASAYVEVKELADTLNMTPYTVFNHEHWKLLNIVLMGKVAELKLVVEDIAKDNKEIDCWPLMKAIDLILTY